MAHHVGYLYESPRDFLERVGFDVEQLPSREDCAELLREELARDSARGLVRRVVGELDGRTISVVTIEIPEDEPGRYVHFHILDPALRGQGLGAALLLVPLRALMELHRLDRVFLEPSADNPPINRLIEGQLGLPLVESFEKAAGQWALTVEVNRYEATRERVEQLVAGVAERFDLCPG